ncbi:PTS sugar transporter subunit IIC [Fusobacterium sp.]|uniref:PTS mannose/fructose/sorbose/N-acetylgalactosamine transporter subunit IIC n=1 Tax=Fusobacterium sp. TaxID=68766 RepID=UPI0025C03D63|nr:PTS sugar transporter subunit IIC [Fusobacterium sp.]
MLLQATLIGLFCYLGALSVPWAFGLTGGWYVLSRPLVSGMIVGAILGDVQTGIMIGIAVQAVYIAMVTPGGTMPADLNFVAYPAIALGILSGKDPKIAVTLAATIGILGTVVFNMMQVINSYWADKTDKAISSGDISGLRKYSVYCPQFGNFILRFVPSFIAVYFGAEYVVEMLDAVPQVVINIMNVLGGILPAVGIGVLLKQIVKENSILLFFIVGFICVTLLKLSMIGLAIIGVFFAYLHFNYKPVKVATITTIVEDEEDEF